MTELVDRLIEAFNAGDVEAFAALTADDVEIYPLRSLLEGTVLRGPEAPYDFWSMTAETWSDLRVEVNEVLDRGDHAVVSGLLRARGRGTGIELETPLGWVLSFRDGLITLIRTCSTKADALEAARELG